MINSRFTVAVHLLSLLAAGSKKFPGVPITSEVAAESVNTNPVVVRRIMGNLRKAGLVTSQPGPNGGWFLEREPESVTLREVYRAVQDEQLFSMHHSKPNSQCMVGGYIQEALQGYFHEAEAAMEAKLDQKTIADVLTKVRDCAHRQGRIA
jgi:Rrf2 family protein